MYAAKSLLQVVHGHLTFFSHNPDPCIVTEQTISRNEVAPLCCRVDLHPDTPNSSNQSIISP